jgi:hypothetical protein
MGWKEKGKFPYQKEGNEEILKFLSRGLKKERKITFCFFLSFPPLTFLQEKKNSSAVAS